MPPLCEGWRQHAWSRSMELAVCVPSSSEHRLKVSCLPVVCFHSLDCKLRGGRIFQGWHVGQVQELLFSLSRMLRAAGLPSMLNALRIVSLELCNKMAMDVPKGLQVKSKTDLSPLSKLLVTVTRISVGGGMFVLPLQVGALGNRWLEVVSISTSFFHLGSLATLCPYRSRSALLNPDQVTSSLPC